MGEQQRQKDEIGQPLGLRPEPFAQKAETLEQVPERYDKGDGQEGGKNKGKHGGPER